MSLDKFKQEDEWFQVGNTCSVTMMLIRFGREAVARRPVGTENIARIRYSPMQKAFCDWRSSQHRPKPAQDIMQVTARAEFELPNRL